MLVDTLRPEDTIGIVTYAGQAHAVLEPTKVSEKAKIVAAIDELQAGGSTAGGSGIEIAYRMAEASFDKAAVNRIVLGTDGDFNVGIRDTEQLKSYIERKRRSGIFLSILGFGRGNYNDALMQALAQNGNGTAAYIDTLNEARKVLAEEASSTLFPIAKDVKIQVEFNPATVSEYRLIGYETRTLRREDFNNDKVDAGEIGSGHAVTAIYELTPAGAQASSDPLRYQAKAEVRPAPQINQELGFLKIRYKLPNEETSRLIEQAVRAADAVSMEQASVDVRFSTAVAAFGQLLRGEPHLGSFSYDEVIVLANNAKGSDAFGYRAELVNLVRLAKSARP
jgi:Ca-activated chloride channel family protein